MRLILRSHQAGVVFVSFHIAQAQAALHGLEPTECKERIHNARHAVELQAPIGFLRVGDAEDGGLAELGLHDLAAGVHCGLPGGVHEAEALAVLRHVAEDLHGDLDQNAEGAFRALHDVVYLGAGGRGRVIQCLEGACRGDVFLAEDDVVGVAVIGRGLARTQCHDPAAHRGILEGLRKVAAGIAELGAERVPELDSGLSRRQVRTCPAGRVPSG